jgi:hypothetical protein
MKATTLKNYTAIYSTKSIKNIHYSFKSENMDSAIEFCKFKFSVPVDEIQIVCDSEN